ncbi:MAG: toxin HipA [Bdellovibrionales bacterium GWA2_49_15]|nr:MAG: toxin HipA [Bdellovibrionales bacterium GWA2_49_15]HAZ11685.1 toxin HipA [Bdellovibrionales bacterium]
MKTIEVWADWVFLHTPQKIGTLIASITRGKEIFSFEYEKDWLKSSNKFQIDPKLQLFEGKYHPPEGVKNFGVFLDSSPDRWGEVLMLRREALYAKEEQRAVKTLMPSDFLLGVYDENRMGGLRFKIGDGPFLDDHHKKATPPWTTLRELEQASLALEEEGAENDPHFSEWLQLLFAPGSSLGGTRPKANVLDTSNNLWIAKFPSKNDIKDAGAWEAVVYELARNCGIKVAEAKVQKLANKYHTFLVQRFDRTTDGRRIHFASAMTLLEHKDGDNADSGASYSEFVDFIISHGSPRHVDSDLEELWKRIVFSIAVSNSDDHLRNHGFLLTQDGWILSPAYDINPNEMATGLSLNISLESNALDYDLAKSVAKDFRLSSAKANEIIAAVKTEVALWKGLANKYGIGRPEQERMQKAFRV